MEKRIQKPKPRVNAFGTEIQGGTQKRTVSERADELAKKRREALRNRPRY